MHKKSRIFFLLTMLACNLKADAPITMTIPKNIIIPESVLQRTTQVVIAKDGANVYLRMATP